ncbi:MAG TPA: tRNA pseudouridine(38-40) synthase TruA [Terriglobales bacterium]|nr:tRNA pseudouridine(38-40) synthase TruA [Terriglobales bacterium]
MRNLQFTLAYDGADFSGWQVQPDRPTVQGALADAIARVTGERVLPQGSGRTDAGVHALAQVATCELRTPIPMDNLRIALNDTLPAAIRVLWVTEAAPGFHARHSARAKTYAYRIFRGDVCPPFLARCVWHYPYPLDEDAIFSAAALVEGTHDFTSFAAVDPDRTQRDEGEPPSAVRTIFSSRWVRARAETPLAALLGDAERDLAGLLGFASDDEEWVYVVRGDGFLHHMVRNLVGLFLLIGKGTVAPPQVAEILAARSRSANPAATAPAGGLFLVNVEY